MNENQRENFFNHVKQCAGFSLENEQCRHFYARFDPKNQYIVSCFYDGKAEDIPCYKFDGEYRITKNRFVQTEYIKNVVRSNAE